MTNNNTHSRNNIINNVAVASNKIKLSMYKGVLSGNIIEGEIVEETDCDLPNALVFSCADNSEYITLL